MTDYKKLVEALRCCSKHERRCLECEFLHNGYCSLQLDAADAIEALLKENKELIEDHPEMVEADGHWEWRKPNGEVLMPKLGEVVRCRECRWGIMCVIGQHLGLDGFCSKGEREVQE